jgi:ribosomal protein L29
MKKDFNEMGRAELEKLLADMQADLRKMRFDFVLSAVDNTSGKKILRRNSARIKTMLKEMVLGLRTEDNKYVGAKRG